MTYYIKWIVTSVPPQQMVWPTELKVWQQTLASSRNAQNWREYWEKKPKSPANCSFNVHTGSADMQCTWWLVLIGCSSFDDSLIIDTFWFYSFLGSHSTTANDLNTLSHGQHPKIFHQTKCVLFPLRMSKTSQWTHKKPPAIRFHPEQDTFILPCSDCNYYTRHPRTPSPGFSEDNEAMVSTVTFFTCDVHLPKFWKTWGHSVTTEWHGAVNSLASLNQIWIDSLYKTITLTKPPVGCDIFLIIPFSTDEKPIQRTLVWDVRQTKTLHWSFSRTPKTPKKSVLASKESLQRNNLWVVI